MFSQQPCYVHSTENAIINLFQNSDQEINTVQVYIHHLILFDIEVNSV